LHCANVSLTEELDAIDWYRQRADDAEDETLKAMDYLNRGRSHLPDAVWREIDKAAAEAARDRLTGRRFLELQGPFGTDLTSIEAGNDDHCRQPSADEAAAVTGRAISVPMLRRAFRLSVRRIAGYLENGQLRGLVVARRCRGRR
jgi:DNA segregation ATPase FtsK/SpoIIIE-like protein